NFDDDITGPTSLRVGFQHSVNLVYIRLMRELVDYYTAEADYDQKAILADLDNPKRRELLDSSLDFETRDLLAIYWSRYRGDTYEQALGEMCGKDARGMKRLAIFALADNPDASVADLRALAHRVYPSTTAQQDTMMRVIHRTYAHKIHSEQDEAYLLGRHPL